jgi:hypothetical protein
MNHDLIIFSLYIAVSLAVFLYAFFKDRQKLVIKWSGVSKFVGFMVLLSMYRLCIMDASGQINILPLKMWHFLFVIFEDMFYVMLPYYITKKINNKTLKITIWTFFSVYFASGHLYQGYFVAFITGFYPYFVSRRYAIKTSFTTVMACHFIYDCMTFLSLKIAKILSYV